MSLFNYCVTHSLRAKYFNNYLEYSKYSSSKSTIRSFGEPLSMKLRDYVETNNMRIIIIVFVKWYPWLRKKNKKMLFSRSPQMHRVFVKSNIFFMTLPQKTEIRIIKTEFSFFLFIKRIKNFQVWKNNFLTKQLHSKQLFSFQNRSITISKNNGSKKKNKFSCSSSWGNKNMFQPSIFLPFEVYVSS